MAKQSGGNRNTTSLRNPNGAPGIYDIFRVGENTASSGLAFGSPSFVYTDQYGITGHHGGKTTLQYTVDIKNPLVISLNKDVKEDNMDFTNAAYRKLGGKGASTQLEKDHVIGKLLVQKGYDALMYKGADGRVLEIAVPNSKMGAGRKTRESTYFSRQWGQTKAEYIKSQTELYISWGNTPADAKRFAVENAREKEKEWKKRKGNHG